MPSQRLSLPSPESESVAGMMESVTFSIHFDRENCRKVTDYERQDGMAIVSYEKLHILTLEGAD